MSISFTALRAFHAVAEHGGFTAAARALGISQPTITTQVKDLEERYGIELFLRRGRNTQLTDAGIALLDITRRLMSEREDAHDLLTGYGKLSTGELRVAAVGPFHAMEMIARFRPAYPAVRIRMQLGNSERVLAMLLDLEADVAILAHSVEDDRILTVPYRRHEVVVFVHRAHPWFERTRVALAELASEAMVLRESGSTTRRAFEEAMQQAGLTIDCALEVGSREGVWKAVQQGLGIGVVADFEFVPHADLRTLAIADARITTEYRIACLRDRRHAYKVRAFIDAALERPPTGTRR